jgi:hypothetical protein
VSLDACQGTCRSESHKWKHRTCNRRPPPFAPMPSITHCSFVMVSSQASHHSLAPGPPHMRGILSCGRRPSVSFARIRKRRGCSFKGHLARGVLTERMPRGPASKRAVTPPEGETPSRGCPFGLAPGRVPRCLGGEQLTPPARACSTPRERRGTCPALPLYARPRSALSCGRIRRRAGRSLAGTWTSHTQNPSGPRTTGHVFAAAVPQGRVRSFPSVCPRGDRRL